MTTRRNKARVRAERAASGTLAPKPAPAKPESHQPSSFGHSLLLALSGKRSWKGISHVWEGGSRSTRKRAPESKDAARQERRNQKRAG